MSRLSGVIKFLSGILQLSITEKVRKNYIPRIGIVPAHRVEWIGEALGGNL
jgi:hypothetical protein